MKNDDPFLSRIRKEREALQKQLADLDTAERVYLGIGPKTGQFPFVEAAANQTNAIAAVLPKMTIKDAILTVLGEAGSRGMDASELLQSLQTRGLADMKRENLYPKLSYFKHKRWLSHDLEQGLWKITDEGRKELLFS
ncbi:MAG: hypothetical protein KGJ66_00010 [Alphaproteobacteria bacterium]|nr:hypothetical protein [Alphaproteobacteria bacterium]